MAFNHSVYGDLYELLQTDEASYPDGYGSFRLDGTPPLYSETCEPLAALDGPWDEHSYVCQGEQGCAFNFVTWDDYVGFT